MRFSNGSSSLFDWNVSVAGTNHNTFCSNTPDAMIRGIVDERFWFGSAQFGLGCLFALQGILYVHYGAK
jgi:hypothetical protein